MQTPQGVRELPRMPQDTRLRLRTGAKYHQASCPSSRNWSGSHKASSFDHLLWRSCAFGAVNTEGVVVVYRFTIQTKRNSRMFRHSAVCCASLYFETRERLHVFCGYAFTSSSTIANTSSAIWCVYCWLLAHQTAIRMRIRFIMRSLPFHGIADFAIHLLSAACVERTSLRREALI